MSHDIGHETNFQTECGWALDKLDPDTPPLRSCGGAIDIATEMFDGVNVPIWIIKREMGDIQTKTKSALEYNQQGGKESSLERVNELDKDINAAIDSIERNDFRKHVEACRAIDSAD